MEGINVLSLCDGIATGRYVLDKLDIPVANYYASEIDINPILIAKSNYSDINHIGDLRMIQGENIPVPIDLMMFGFCCQSLSITTGANRQNLDGKSGIFFDCLRIMNEVKPKWFLVENVASMSDECRDIISAHLGVQPIHINSNCFSAQDRERYYWTNIPVDDVSKLQPSKEVLKDIMQKGVDEKFYYKQDYDYHGEKQVCATLHINGHDILKRVMHPNFKCHTLTAVCGGNQQKKVLDNGRVRKLTPVEYERLQTLPDGYTNAHKVSDTARWKALGNGWTAEVIAWILKGIKE